MSAPSVSVPQKPQTTTLAVATGPLVNLLDSKPPQQLGTEAREARALHHFDDSQVPPEPGVVSEQPEVSDVRQMRAELEMHRHNAKAGVAFVSQSGGEQPYHQRTTNNNKTVSHRHRRARERAPTPHISLRNQRHRRRREPPSTVSETSGSYTGDSRTRSGSSHTRTATADAILSNAVQESIRDDERAGVSTDARRYAAGGGNQNLAAVTVASAKPDKLESAKSFVKSNLTLIITCVVLLALVGVTVYLMFKSNGDSAERDAERERERALAADEERVRESDAVLQELQRENEQLKVAYEKNADAIQQYEHHLNQYQAQNNAQMQALEALEAQNTEYERAMDEWQRFYAQLEPQNVEENEKVLVDEQREPESQHVGQNEQQGGTIVVKEERANTPAAVQSDTEQLDYNFNDEDLQQDQQDRQEQQEQPEPRLQQANETGNAGGSSPTKLLPPLENREQVPFGTLVGAQKQTMHAE